MAKAVISFENGRDVCIESITKVIEHNGSTPTEYDVFESMVFYVDDFYSFVGSSTLHIHGSKINSVMFL